MSIYCSRITVGRDTLDDQDIGRVASYPLNQLSLIEVEGWPIGSISTAHIPVWSVPDADLNVPRDEYDGSRVSEWLRLSIDVGGLYADVLIDREAAVALADDLRVWSSLPMVKSGDD